MRAVRKVNETGHFSEVDTVSSQLFDRMAGDGTRGPVQAPAALEQNAPAVEDEPFSAIDNVSSHIFDRMEAIEHPEQGATVSGRASGQLDTPQADEFAVEQVAFQVAAFDGVPEGWVLVPKNAAIGSFDDSEGHPLTKRKRRPNPETLDITYRAAQRLSQLPDGADPLVGMPSSVNEESMHASIRELMVAQKRDFNKKALPELEPATPFRSASGARNAAPDCLEKVEEFEEVPDSKLKTALVKFVRTDTVLAICLSIWVSLFLMIFIEPELSQALATISLILLGIFRLMQPSHKKRRVVRIVKRKRDHNDLALEDAILCQDA